MDINIDYKKIKASPSDFSSENIIKSRNDLVNELATDIKFNHGINILIHGYRGTGKTSLITSVISKLISDKHKNSQEEDSYKTNDIKKDDASEYGESSLQEFIFVKLNLTKYAKDKYDETLSLFIRRLSDKYNEDISMSNRKIKDKLKLLYNNTYFNISHNSSEKEAKEKSLHLDINVMEVIKKGISICLIMAAILNMRFNFLTNDIINNAILVIYGLSSLTTTVNISKLNTSEVIKIAKNDSFIMTEKFINCLFDIKREKQKVIFIIDEIDKMEIDEFQSFISDFKEVFLSDSANFILITDEDKYSKIYHEYVNVNSILSSVFSKTIYIPLLTEEDEENIFLEYLKEKKFIENNCTDGEPKEIYLSYLYWNSHGILRKFNNLLIQDMHIADSGEEAYLVLSEDSRNHYETYVYMECYRDWLRELINVDYEKRDYITCTMIDFIQHIKSGMPFENNDQCIETVLGDAITNCSNEYRFYLFNYIKKLVVVMNNYGIVKKDDDNIYIFQNDFTIKNLKSYYQKSMLNKEPKVIILQNTIMKLKEMLEVDNNFNVFDRNKIVYWLGEIQNKSISENRKYLQNNMWTQLKSLYNETLKIDNDEPSKHINILYQSNELLYDLISQYCYCYIKKKISNYADIKYHEGKNRNNYIGVVNNIVAVRWSNTFSGYTSDMYKNFNIRNKKIWGIWVYEYVADERVKKEMLNDYRKHNVFVIEINITKEIPFEIVNSHLDDCIAKCYC